MAVPILPSATPQATTSKLEPGADRQSLIDALRGWAALSVLIYHTFAIGNFPLFPGGDWLAYLQANRAAVLLFFVISGYVIGMTNTRAWSFAAARSYGWRRSLRIVPIYVAAVALGWIASARGSSAIAGHLLFLQDFDRDSPCGVIPMPGNQPLWSLHYEVVYYILFFMWWRFPLTVPLSLIAALAAGITGQLGHAIPAWIASHGVGMLFWLSGLILSRCAVLPAAPSAGSNLWAHILWLHATQHAATVAFFLHGLHLTSMKTSWLSLEDLTFFPGCIVCVALAGRRKIPLNSLWPWASFLVPAAGLTLVLATGKNLSEPRWAVLIFFFVTGILACLTRPVTGFPLLRKVGGFSYGLYAVHAPCLILVSRITHSYATAGATIAVVFAAWILSISLAYTLELIVQPVIRNAFAT